MNLGFGNPGCTVYGLGVAGVTPGVPYMDFGLLPCNPGSGSEKIIIIVTSLGARHGSHARLKAVVPRSIPLKGIYIHFKFG